MSCLRCHNDRAIMCKMNFNGQDFELCPECVVDLERFLRGWTLNDIGVIKRVRKKEGSE